MAPRRPANISDSALNSAELASVVAALQRKNEAEIERLTAIIQEARTALEALERGRALQILRSAFPEKPHATSAAPARPGSAA